ncbi:MAG: hypothetical protein HN929_10945 [Chloroflexi bacterium]|jgi:hypothetical protein|nr:hypothetical protein [Chloroflexota bacterium]
MFPYVDTRTIIEIAEQNLISQIDADKPLDRLDDEQLFIELEEITGCPPLTHDEARVMYDSLPEDERGKVKTQCQDLIKRIAIDDKWSELCFDDALIIIISYLKHGEVSNE